MFVIPRGKSLLKRSQSGQALVEYALILALVAIMFGVALAATGPAIGNVFSNTVYNLLGQDPGQVQDLSLGAGNRESFWATVAWVAANPPADVAVPPNPPRPPTSTPTAGPSPTPTDTRVPLPPTNTPTHTPPPTVTDHAHRAPWLDTIDNPVWWRTDRTVWLGSDDWRGQYFANITLSGEPVYVLWNQQISPNYRGKIDFNWGTESPIVGFQQDNFSIRFTRQIYVQGPDPVRVRFTTTADDGVRLWINYEPGCASVNSGGGPTGSFRVYQDGESDGGDPNKNCLIIDNWRDQSATTYSVVRTIPPGLHVLQLDYYDSGWDARLRLDIEGAGPPNSSDIALGGGTPVCNWGRPADTRANSKDFMWEEDRDGDFPANMRCHLELRGSVDFSALTAPKLVFWDVWDLSAGTRVWLEIAEYHPDPAQRNWQSIPLRSGGTTNYAWTRNVIDLVPYISGYASRRLTFRFVMENNGGGSNRRWYVDDVQVADFNTNNRFFTVCSGSKDTCGSYWNLNSPAQARDFITSGRWALTSAGGLTGGGGDLGWDDSPGDIYYRNYEGTDASPRVHYVEFNGWIDLTGGMPDADGDDGPPQLSFYMRYDIGRRTTLALQWTRDQHDLTADNWNTFEILVPYNASNSQTDLTWRLRQVLLTSIPNWNTQPFRMRFAMIVPQSAYERDGWYIDEIYLERVGRQKFTDYPFFDDAERGMGNWLGQWAVTDTVPGHLGSRFSFADSPNGNYIHNTEPYMELRYFIDLNNDTPANRNEFFENNPAGGNSQVTPANRPILTFWFRRELSNSDNLLVEWTKTPSPQPSDWRVAWAYYFAAGTNIQRAWERIEIDLSFLQAGTLGNENRTDDDILIRFRLDARSGGPTSVADGVYVDNISIRDYTEESHRLWDPSVNTGFGAGQNTRYADDIENRWWERWYTGGNWAGVSFERRNGLNAFHDSPPENTSTTVQTYNVLEMIPIIDLRSVTSGDRPTLYFWNRYDIGSNHAIRVQVSAENTSYTRSVSETNYERRTGWDNWTTVWNRGGSSRVDTWIREQIDLSGYVGRRIRVRWVMDAYSGSNTRDGWYVDQISFEHRHPQPIRLPFFDPAQNMSNWIAEGIWGLAPDQWRGSGGGPADLGPHFWSGTFYDCQRVRSGSDCSNTSHFNQVLYTDFATLTERPPSTDHRDLKMTALDIYLDLGSSWPPGASTNPTWNGISNSTWYDTFAARFKRDVTIQSSGEYTFITISDDGVRLRWRYKDGAAPPPGYPAVPPGWNILQYWQDTGRYVSIGSVEFVENTNPTLPRYELILEWYERGGSAVLIFSAGRNNFSFTDSPRAGSNPALFPVVNSIPFGNSSLILRQPLDLGGTFRPALEYYTRYQINGDGSANVEVSTDGGFTWTRNNLTSNADGWTCPPSASCRPNWNGSFWSTTDPNLWQLRQHNLSSYKAVRFINLRFRLQTGASSNDGWYITDIQVNAASIGP